MRRLLLLLTLLACLAVPSAALAVRRAVGDGTLVVRHGDGMLRLDVAGAVIGRIEGGQLDVISPTLDTCDDLNVWGADKQKTRSRIDGAIVCHFAELRAKGTRQPIRFRVVLDQGDTLIIRRAVEFSVSAVGRGPGVIKGAGGASDGRYSLNGKRFASLPDEPESFILGATLR